MIAKLLIVASLIGWGLYVVFWVLHRPPHLPRTPDPHEGGV